MKRLQPLLNKVAVLLAANPYALSDGVRTPEGNGTVVAVERNAVQVLLNSRSAQWFAVRHVEFVRYRAA